MDSHHDISESAYDADDGEEAYMGLDGRISLGDDDNDDEDGDYMPVAEENMDEDEDEEEENEEFSEDEEQPEIELNEEEGLILRGEQLRFPRSEPLSDRLIG